LEELKTKIKATESVATVAHSVSPPRPTPPPAAPELPSQPPLQTATAAPPPARRYDRATQTESAAPTSVAKPVPATPRLAREARGTSPSRLSSNAHPSALRGGVSDAGSLAAIPEADPGFSAFLSRASRTVEDVLWRPPPPLLAARLDSSLVGVGSSGADSGVASGGSGAFDSAQRTLLLVHPAAAGRPVGDMDWIRQVPDKALVCYHSRTLYASTSSPMASERLRGAEGLAIVWNVPSAQVRRARPGMADSPMARPQRVACRLTLCSPRQFCRTAARALRRRASTVALCLRGPQQGWSCSLIREPALNLFDNRACRCRLTLTL